MKIRLGSRVALSLFVLVFLTGLFACATAPIDKARRQADKDWAQAAAGAEKYQQLQRQMVTGEGPAVSKPQSSQTLLTPEEHRRQAVQKREEVYADEWRMIEHDVAKRVLQRGLEPVSQPAPYTPSIYR